MEGGADALHTGDTAAIGPAILEKSTGFGIGRLAPPDATASYWGGTDNVSSVLEN